MSILRRAKAVYLWTTSGFFRIFFAMTAVGLATIIGFFVIPDLGGGLFLQYGFLLLGGGLMIHVGMQIGNLDDFDE